MLPSVVRHSERFALGVLAGLLGAALSVVVLLMLATVLAIAGLTTIDRAMPPSILAGLGVFGLSSIVGLAKSLASRELIVSSAGLRWSGLWPPRPAAPVALVLRGAPGAPMELRAREFVVARFPPHTGARGWDYASAGWAARRAAELMGVPLTDERDAEAWRRWTEDAGHRAMVAFDRDLDLNTRQLPWLRRGAPIAPQIVFELHGEVVRWGGHRIAIDKETVRCGRISVRLDTITRVDALFDVLRSKRSRTLMGSVVLVSGGTRHTLVRGRIHEGFVVRVGNTRMNLPDIAPDDARRLHGIVGWLRAAVARAAPATDRGDESDVPEALAGLRASMSQTE